MKTIVTTRMIIATTAATAPPIIPAILGGYSEDISNVTENKLMYV